MLDLVKKILGMEATVELDEEGKKVVDLFEKTSNNYFLTGNAGTGKSTLVNYFRTHTKKKVAVLAPTGLAAINVRGQTIHSFFHFPPRMLTQETVHRIKYNSRLFKQLDTIVIDEASMIRADMLDAIDWFLRKHGKDKNLPFGGIQLILVGDLFQLPPVLTYSEMSVFSQLYTSPYFFSAQAYQQSDFQTLKLTKIFRQHDEHFISVLNQIRYGDVSMEALEPINKRVQKKASFFTTQIPVTLATTNKVVQEINTSRLATINKDEHTFTATIENEFPQQEAYFPVEMDLKLKEGARVMFVKNGGTWVNGSLGVVHKLEKNQILVKMDVSNEVISVPLEEWEHVRYEYNETTETVEASVLGRLKQYPLRLAWAITVHKSQGMTFDTVKIDYSKSPFTHGQTYVALSRCRTLDGLTLTKDIYPNDVIVDQRVIEFMRK